MQDYKLFEYTFKSQRFYFIPKYLHIEKSILATHSKLLQLISSANAKNISNLLKWTFFRNTPLTFNMKRKYVECSLNLSTQKCQGIYEKKTKDVILNDDACAFNPRVKLIDENTSHITAESKHIV